jgi:hypothetical protein
MTSSREQRIETRRSDRPGGTETERPRRAPGQAVLHDPHLAAPVDVGQRIGQAPQIASLDSSGLFDLGSRPSVVALKGHIPTQVIVLGLPGRPKELNWRNGRNEVSR